MQKIILDTNVLVSSLIQKSYLYLIVSEIFTGNKITLCISDALMFEYYEVLKRKKFSKYPDFIFNSETLLADIEKKAILFNPTIILRVISDLADNRLLELADESDVDFLITGNTNDFTITNYKKTRIVTPREYFEDYRQF